MYTWNNVFKRKYYYELEHKISLEKLKEIADNTSLCQIPRLVMLYSELVQGIPLIFKHYVANVPALHLHQVTTHKQGSRKRLVPFSPSRA